MGLVPLLVQGSGSSKSLVSQITFYEEDEDDLSESEASTTSFIGNHKWSSEKEPCHAGIPSERSNDRSESASSPKHTGIPMPERKCSTHDLFDLSAEDGTLEALKKSLRDQLLMSLIPKQQEGMPSENFGCQKSREPNDRMANTKWDHCDISPSRGTPSLLSSIASTSTSSSVQSKTSFSRISMAGSIERSLNRQLVGETKTFSSSSRHSNKSSRHSTMPLTMPIRKPSTQDLKLASNNGSSNALRRKLSRPKLSNSDNLTVPRRIGSASSMVRNQSRDRLRRYG